MPSTVADTTTTDRLRESRVEKPKKSGFSLNRLLRIVFVLVPLGIAGNVIYAVASTDPAVVSRLTQVNTWYLALAVVAVLIPLGAQGTRAYLWSRVFGHPLKVGQATRAAVINELGGAITPTACGGGYAKLFYLVKLGFTPGQATMMMVIGSIEDFLFVLIALPLTIWFTNAWDNPHVVQMADKVVEHWPWAIVIILGVMSLFVTVQFFMRRKKSVEENGVAPEEAQGKKGKWIGGFLRDVFGAFKFGWRNGKGTFAACTALSSFGWVCRYVSINFLILGLGLEVQPVMYALFHWLVFTTMNFVPTPGAAGGAEVAFAVIFGGLLPAAVLPVLTSAWRFLTFYFNTLLGAVYLAIAGPGFDEKK